MTDVIATTGDWAEAIAALPASGPLALRTVVVPNGRVAHALRRQLLDAGRGGLLIGTRFASAAVLAAEALALAGVTFAAGEEARRPARVLRCFRDGPSLAHFRPLARPGWDVAFARAIGDLEAAGLRPDSVPIVDAQLADVVAVWRAVDAEAGTSWTAARILGEAAARPAIDCHGAILAVIGAHTSGAEAAFVRALPGVRLARLARGEDVETASERDLLATYLFAPPDVLGDPARPHSAGRDGTADLEEHAGVEAELAASAEWVTREVLEHATPLAELAVLVPRADPLAAMVAERLARVGVAAFVAGGVPAVATATGARIRALLDALLEHLPAAAVARVLPSLRPARAELAHVSHSGALALAYGLGTAGGSVADPRGALAWSDRLAARAARLRLVEDDERDHGESARRLADLEAVTPAFTRLVALAGLHLDGQPLGRALIEFLNDWLLCPQDGIGLIAQLAESIDGEDTLAAISDRFDALRVAVGRAGDAAVYVGTVRGAVGLSFRALRVIGLAEGAIPSPPREDAVLPDRLRQMCPPVPDSAARVHGGRHALDWAVRAARERVVLSASRVGLDGSAREPSSVMLAAAAALRRPHATSGAPGVIVPDLTAVRRDAFAPARASAADFRRRWPVGAAAWHDRIARGFAPPPPSWRAPGGALDLERLIALGDPARPADALDGLLGAGVVPALPGTSAERAISSYRLKALLECPYRFLLDSVLGWSDPEAPRPIGEIDQMTYGTLFHAVAEAFSRAHGAEFGRRERSLAAWTTLAMVFADAALDALFDAYPLLGDAVRGQQRDRLRRQVADFLAYDWGDGTPRRFVDVERSFGYDAPLVLDGLYVHGFIDRLDVEGDTTVVRDLKSGGAHPRRGRETEADPSRDVQIALYGRAVSALAASWGLPSRVAVAYAYADGKREHERAFRDDYATLEARAGEWLAIAAGLLAERAFPRTIREADCRYCAFNVVCGPRPWERAAAVHAGAGGAVARFRVFKEGQRR